MISKIHWTVGIIIFLSSLFVYSCVNPEENAINESKKKSASTISQKTGPAIYLVEIGNMKFNPAEITVHKGDTVVWKNNDMVTHCVTEESAKAWTSAQIVAGASWKMAVSSGADYFCAIHLVMKGKIKVE